MRPARRPSGGRRAAARPGTPTRLRPLLPAMNAVARGQRRPCSLPPAAGGHGARRHPAARVAMTLEDRGRDLRARRTVPGRSRRSPRAARALRGPKRPGAGGAGVRRLRRRLCRRQRACGPPPRPTPGRRRGGAGPAVRHSPDRRRARRGGRARPRPRAAGPPTAGRGRAARGAAALARPAGRLRRSSRRAAPAQPGAKGHAGLPAGRRCGQAGARLRQRTGPAPPSASPSGRAPPRASSRPVPARWTSRLLSAAMASWSSWIAAATGISCCPDFARLRRARTCACAPGEPLGVMALGPALHAPAPSCMSSCATGRTR